ncbi:Cytoplasmic dynein 2 heavy chain 1 (Dynein heavy chain isotype 1B) [Durusdinium trenchii]|uniref:Cytoplasmic dynein 2 heavy chain 1 n=1 Tax=Durusdinium trenchii TaxID=1381693 RepID=A0ABP0QJU3_9DINO
MPRSEDARVEYVLSCVQSLCKVQDVEALRENDVIAAFVNDGAVRSLHIAVKDKGGSFVVSVDDDIAGSSGSNLQLHFAKQGVDALDEENIREQLVVTPVQSSPLASLYHSLHSVYAPALLNDPSFASRVSPDVQDLLCQLDNQLQTLVRGGSSEAGADNDGAKRGGGSDPSDPASVQGIIHPIDEVKFWEDQAATHGRGQAKRRAEAILKTLEPVKSSLESVATLDLVELRELVDELNGALDDLWKIEFSNEQDRFPQMRMEHLFRVIGNAIVQRCCATIKDDELWTDAFAKVRRKLEAATQVCEQWISCTKELTGSHWATYLAHPWQATAQKNSRESQEENEGDAFGGGKHSQVFSDTAVEAFSQRIDEILRLRTTHEELSRLLEPDEVETFGVEENLEVFRHVRALFVNKYTQPAWETALVKYEESIAPIERSIAAKLSQRLKRGLQTNAETHPLILVGEFVKFKNLVIRPEIKRALRSERETVVARVAAFIDELDAEFDARSARIARGGGVQTEGKSDEGAASSGVPLSRNLSPTINAIVWGRQVLNSVESVYSASLHLFEDLSSFDRLQETAQSLSGRIESWLSDVFRDWSMDIEEQLADGELSLHLTGQLMEIDLKGLLQVNFSERLVTVLREVRQLGELGMSVPAKVKKAAKEAERYYRHGVMLKKTANYFNSMESQIIESQKAMLFEALVEFESEVTNPRLAKGSKRDGAMVTWGNPSDCQAYVERLRQAADKLSAENRRLHKTHEKLGSEVVRLMDIDILRQADRWKQQWNKLNSVMVQMEASYEPKRMVKWKRHWDCQVYKSLEASYRMGLESLNENLGEIKTDLVFTNHKLQFRPPTEDLRTTYYRKMKKFIAIPAGFKGFSGGAHSRELFGKMADRNAASLLQVYTKAEALFRKLDDLVSQMQPYTVLGTVQDLDSLVEEVCVHCSDWEVNFKMLKAKRRELDKVHDFYKIDCVAVSTAAFKMAVEDQLSRLSDALMVSLRKSVLGVLKTVEQYLDASMERLSKRPETIEEISEATAEWGRISGDKKDIKSKWNKTEDRRKLLLAMSSSLQQNVAVDISEVMDTHGRLPGKWENFEVALIAFNDMIEDQREALKARVDDDVESCQQTIGQFVSRWESLKPGREGVESWANDAVQAIFEELDEWKTQFDAIKQTAQTCASNCEHFELPAPRFEQLEDVERDFENTQEEWAQYRKFSEQLAQLRHKDWISFRTSLYDAEDFARVWLEQIKGKARGLVLEQIAQTCGHLRKAIPALKFMRGEPFKEEHWNTLFKKLGMPKGTSLQSLTFGHFVDVIDVVADNLQFAKDMTARAQGEVTIREAIMELKSWAETATVEMMDHEEMGRNTPLIKNWKEILTDLGDNQSLLASLKESQYYKPFEQQASVYEQNMASLDAYLGMMNQVQRKWLYLEPIFGRGALPSEANRFRRIDEDWVDTMGKLAAEPLLFNLCDEGIFPRMNEILSTMVDQLERCQKALADFLEEKRSKLPRFYFIGDDDLLEILGQAKNPEVIQAHLKKLFQGIHSVRFTEDQTAITAICSSAGEKVSLEHPVQITDQVEVWLQSLSDEMRRTLQTQLVRCVHEKKQVNLTGYPSQVLCLAENIKFTSRCEHAIKQGKIASLRKLLRKTLQGYTSADLSKQPLSQLKVKSLILDLVHNIDVCDQLEKAGVTSLEDWHWDKQLRYYLNTDNQCVVRMCDAEIKYTYEYWGNAAKLVHTPLTDKCYLTLTQGMHMGFGGSPYGPAGTGKTESVKALGSCLGRQVLVFNCDEGLDFQSMGRIFTGLVKCGAWGCFDEFNRLKEDQLSAVSQQIQVIQAAIKAKSSTLKLLGRNIDVDFNAGIFVTMNPAGKGYGGRSKLPDNLKQLFRPVAMSRPDNNLIAEVILYSEGFQEAKDLGQKLVSLYALSKELLSPQLHYDWGLRAMKAVLNTGGKLLMAHKRSNEGTPASETERELLIKAIRVNTLSKLTFVDAQAFLGLIGDVFPGSESRDVDYEELEQAIREVLQDPAFGLEYSETQVRKMMQLKESLDQRMGCVVVGPSGCGKSTLWSVLKVALRKIGTEVKTYVMNPKSMPRERLLGYMDMDTREWFDGVLTNAARAVVKEPKEVRSWIVCDGDVDPEWIESLNSVLDDNKLLTMPNGERISFGSNVNFIFETHDLRFASPATISRMGMIFLSDEDVDVKRLVHCWLQQQLTNTGGDKTNGEKQVKEPEDDQVELLAQWIDDLFYNALDWVLRQDAFVVETTMVGTVKNGLSHIRLASSKPEFCVGLIRGLGGNLDLDTRADFARHCFELAGESPPSNKTPLDCFCDRGVLAPFSPRTEMEGDFARLGNGGAIIQTVSVQRNLAMVQQWMDGMEPFILVGPEGCGKTMLLSHCFRLASRTTSVTTLHCNAQTTAAHVIQKIQQSCSLFSTNSGRVYRPREAERLVLYLKDINLPKPDKYDTCMLIAFLQQLATCHGFYDDNLEFLGIENVHIVASMNPATTVGRHTLSSRFTAMVRIAYVDYPEPDELVGVYATILEDAVHAPADSGLVVSDPKWQNPSNLRKLAETMVDLFKSVKSKFSVDDQRHYLFTPRDLTEWVLSLLNYDTRNEDLLDIFAYEANRIFRDRLVDADAKNRFDGILANVLRKDWQHRLDSLDEVVFSSLNAPGGSVSFKTSEESKDEETKDGGEQSVSRHQLIRIPLEEFRAVVEHGLMMYEREEKELNIKLFPQVLHQLARVDRVLSRKGGSMLLAGRCGVGRRTATMLAAHMHGMEFFTPNLSSASGTQGSLKSFCNELKHVVQTAGVEGRHTVLYVEDHQIFAEEVLEMLNSLLCSGEVPGLFKHEELVPLLEPLKELMNDEIGDGSVRNPLEFFVRRVQQFLHVVVSMDPSNDKFLLRCESNPALYTTCSILWFGEWSRQAIQDFPGLYLPEFFGEDAPEDWDPRALQSAVSSIHDACKAHGAAPRDLVAFLDCFKHLYETKAGAITKKVSQFLGGLAKLEEAEQTVDELSADAGKQRVELQRKQQAADESMEEITEALTHASKTRKETETLSTDLKTAEEETKTRKANIEAELSEIQPVLEQAKEAVGKIKSDNLNELRSLKAPPEPVSDVLKAVLMLLGINDTSWQSMRKFLGNRGVKEDIMAFDTHRITPEIRAQVTKLLRARGSSFERATIQRVSVAAAPFAAWVKANIRYSLVLEKIQPLEQELDEAKEALDSAQERMQACEDELAEIDDRVKALQDNFKKSTKEATQLGAKLQDTEETLEKAQKLLAELGGEKERWSSQAEDLRRTIGTLPMRILLSAAFVTYLGKAPEDVRQRELRVWSTEFCGLSGNDDESKQDLEGKSSGESAGASHYDVKRILSSESEMLVWKSQQGLPGDDLSMENAIIIVNSPEARCPFIVDPANGATRWLRSNLAADAAQAFEVVSQQDPRFVNQVELAVRFGKTLVVVEVDGVDPMLYPLVRRDLKRQGPRWVVQVGDKLIDYHEKFRLLLVTRNPDPLLPPDACSLVNEVNFTVTRSGLEGQLLGVTVQHEQPELEQQKSEVLKQEEDFKVQLSELERELLDTLAASEGNLLENQVLLDTLTKTKEKSAEVSELLERSATVSAKLDTERNQYRAFAAAGSQLYFAITGLARVNHMYQFSLQSFVQLFRNTLEQKDAAGDVQDRMDRLILQLEKRVLYFCGRALFKADRLMFAMHLVRNVRPQLFQEGEWEFLAGDAVSLAGHSVSGGLVEGKEGGGDDDDTGVMSSTSSCPSWVATDRVARVEAFREAFPRLFTKLDLSGQQNDWARWGRHPECEKIFPASLGLTVFQKVLVTEMLRPDRLESAMTMFCCDALDVTSLSPPSASIQHLMESREDCPDPSVPILLVATPGADPTSELQEFAAKTVGKDHYLELAMGGGQTEDALVTLRDAARNGDWLCLKNLHLVASWIPRLEKEFNALHKRHDNFRLWLTTEETSQFAPILLQQSWKLTFEAPPGIKKNLQRTYDSWPEELVQGNGETQATLLFLLAWMHALMQERRTYIPQGWTKFYEFSLGDLRSGVGVVELAMDTLAGRSSEQHQEGKDDDERGQEGIDWAYIHGLMENSVYGGRIDNPFDLRVLRAYLDKFFNNDMLEGGRGILLAEGLKVPENMMDKEEAMSWIDRLDDTDVPSMFGLPPNIERSVQRARSTATVNALKALSLSASGPLVFDRTEWCKKLQPVIKLWEKQVSSCGDALLAKPSFDGSKAGKDDSRNGEVDPIELFVLLEEQRAYTVVSRVDRAIRNISRVVSGSGLLSPQIQADAATLMEQSVPAEWQALWEGPGTPAEWLRAVATRKVALKEWVRQSRKGTLFNKTFDLAELLNPGTFLNALRQLTARETKSSMDGLRMISAWDERELEAAKRSIAVTGLSLQGALLEDGRLCLPDADAPELVSAPTCFVGFVPEAEAAAFEQDRSAISLPLYEDSGRETLLMQLSVPLPKGHSEATWITSGAAFFLHG